MEAHLIRRSAIVASAALLAATPCVAASSGSARDMAADARFDALVAAAKDDMLVDPQRAIVRAQEANALIAHAPSAERGATMRATGLWLVGEAEARLNHAVKAVPLLREAERLARASAPGSLLYADITLSLGSAMTDAGQVTDALAMLQRAHRTYQLLGQQRGQAKALILIAQLYSSARDDESALRYYQQAIDTRLSDDALAVSLYNSLGYTLSELKRFNEAEKSLQKAVNLAQRMKSDALLALSLGSLGSVQLRAGDIEAAQRSITRGLMMAQREPARTSLPGFLMLAAKIALQQGHLTRAQELIGRRFAGVNLSSTTLNSRDAHEVAYDVYTRTGQPGLALAHLAALKRLDDQATEIARSNGAALAAAKFDYTNQELRIAKLKADDLQKSVAYERDVARAQRRFFAGIGAAALLIVTLLAIGLLTLRRSRNQTRAANADLETSNVALNKALAAKTEFLATTSHEIRTPLNGILGMTQVMAADPALDATMRDRLAVVHGAGVTMRALVDDILDVAKIESGKMIIEEAPLDLSATVSDAAQLWKDQAAAKGLAFTVEAGPAAWIMGDAARLRQIVFNLLSNAVKFTPTGQVRLTCAVADGRARVVVADTGIGIDPSVHEEIFESFRQADTTTTRQFGGTGLGLSICRNLARAMDGDVTVESRLDEGATFTLDVPAREAANQVVVEHVDVLVVERNPIARATMRAVLEPHGAVAFADTLLDAEPLARRTRPHTILVDHASADGDIATIAAVVARVGSRALLLLPAGVAVDGVDHGVEVLHRPIGKKILLSHVFGADKSLVRIAA